MENLSDHYQDLIPDAVMLAVGDLSSNHSEGILTQVEQEEFSHFRNRRRREEFLSTRVLAKAAGEEMGLSPDDFEVQKDGLGKPFGIYHDRRYYLSLAHSDKQVLCGISDSIPIGVDLEPAKRNVDERLRDRMLHPDERSVLKDIALIRLWTIKESLVKLEGKGLRCRLNEIRLFPEGGTLFSGRFNNDKSARICSFEHNHYWIALAYYQ